MKHLNLFENFDFDENDFDEEEFDTNEEYIIFNHGNYNIVAIKVIGEKKGKLMSCSTSGKLLGFKWDYEFSSMYKLSDNEINNITNNEEVLTAAGFTEYKYTLDQFKNFMDKDIPIKYYTKK